MKRQGFTLVEFAIAAAIVAVLAATAIRGYQQAVMRAQLAQQLVDVGHIRTVVTLESRSGRDLAEGSTPGQAPTGMQGLLPDKEFQEDEALRLQLVHLPVGTVPSMPLDGSYGLIADTTAEPERLWLLQREIEKAGFSTVWLSDRSFAFPIADYVVETTAAVATTPPPPTPATPPAAPSTDTPPVVTPPVEPPVAAAGCPPGWEPRGNSGKCRPVPQGGRCPAGWQLSGSSGNCRSDHGGDD
jgi:prepilin-type N-terminal cleavage/methylation domain-containing protein